MSQVSDMMAMFNQESLTSSSQSLTSSRPIAKSAPAAAASRPAAESSKVEHSPPAGNPAAASSLQIEQTNSKVENSPPAGKEDESESPSDEILKRVDGVVTPPWRKKQSEPIIVPPKVPARRPEPPKHPPPPKAMELHPKSASLIPPWNPSQWYWCQFCQGSMQSDDDDRCHACGKWGRPRVKNRQAGVSTRIPGRRGGKKRPWHGSN